MRTKPLHQRLDDRLNLFSSVNTREEYRAHLYRFYQMLFHMERELLRYPEWRELGIRWEDRLKTQLLRADLIALGYKASELENPKRPQTLPPMGNFAESVGSFYVMEGSTLGAQYISRHFGPKLGLSPETGMSFHTGYGADTGKKWVEFCRALERFFDEYPNEADEAIHSACAAFSSVEENLCSETIQ